MVSTSGSSGIKQNRVWFYFLNAGCDIDKALSSAYKDLPFKQWLAAKGPALMRPFSYQISRCVPSHQHLFA
jgi:hypothetical protein